MGCGGGSDSPVGPPPPPPPPTEAQHYELTVTVDKEYQFDCIKNGENYYCAPPFISINSVTAELVDDELTLFYLNTRGIKGQVQIEDYELTGVANKHELTDIDGSYFQSAYFDEPDISFAIDQGAITGSDTKGCNYDGTIETKEQYYYLEIDVTNCADAGLYTGALDFDLRGMIASLEKGIYIRL